MYANFEFEKQMRCTQNINLKIIHVLALLYLVTLSLVASFIKVSFNVCNCNLKTALLNPNRCPPLISNSQTDRQTQIYAHKYTQITSTCPYSLLLEFLCYIRNDTGDISYAIQAGKLISVWLQAVM